MRKKRKASYGWRRLVALAAVVLVAAGVGSYIVMSLATTASVGVEAESGQVAGKAASCSGPGASGNAVKFGWATCQQQHRTFTNPVFLNLPDPTVLAWEGKYYMVGTSGEPRYYISVSDDLVNWRASGTSVFNGTHPWGVSHFWAPELHRLANGSFAVYYSALGSGGLRVGVATADNVLGPYTDLGRPLVSEAGYGVIDANFFLDDNGRQYLYWKEDGGDTRIFGQELDASGTRLIGERRVVLQKGLAWEGAKGIEGSWVMKKDGSYIMFYSGELYSSDRYAIGVARANSPLAGFSKKGDPILRSGTRWKGPGHNSVVRVGTTDYMVYHAWDRVPGADERDALIDKITWSGGWPAVANGRPTETAQPYPY